MFVSESLHGYSQLAPVIRTVDRGMVQVGMEVFVLCALLGKLFCDCGKEDCGVGSWDLQLLRTVWNKAAFTT